MAEDIKRKLLELVNKMDKKATLDYFIKGGIIDPYMIKEHNKGHRPIDHIEKEYFDELELDVSMKFFKWYLEKYCQCCDCEPCGCDRGCCTCENDKDVPLSYTTKTIQKNSFEQNMSPLVFYDIIACSNQLKKEDIKALKLEYKNDTGNKKQQKNMNEEYYYAKIEHYISPTKWEKERHEDYAIVLGDWAYMKPSGKNSKVQIKAAPKKYNAKILEQYFRRPKDMTKIKADNIIQRLLKSHPNMKLAKPNEKEN